MAISEEARHRLYLALEQSIGPDQATTLMSHLPPVGWADVATKRDLEMQDLKLEAVGRVSPPSSIAGPPGRYGSTCRRR